MGVSASSKVAPQTHCGSLPRLIHDEDQSERHRGKEILADASEMGSKAGDSEW